MRVAPTSSREIRIELETATTFGGIVRSSASGTVAGATVTLRLDGMRIAEATTDREGKYRIAGVRAGPVELEVCAAGHLCIREERIASATGTFDVALRTASTLRVRVLDKDGAPVRGAHVFTASFERCDTLDDGTCSIDHVAPHKTKITVEHVTAGHAEVEVDVGHDQTKQDVRLTPGGTVRGTVRWDDGKPAANVHVWSYRIVTRTGPDGRYELRNVEPGYLHVRAAAAFELGGQRSFEQRFGLDDMDFNFKKLRSGDVVENVDRVLRRKTHRISGTVIASDGAPVAYAGVGLVREDPASPWRAEHAGPSLISSPVTYAGPDGTFTIEDVAKGSYALWADGDAHPPGRVRNIAAGSANVVVKLPAGATLEGQVKDSRGAVVTGLAVRENWTTWRFSSEDGRFKLEGLPAGKHSIVIEGYRTSGDPSSSIGSETFEVAEGERKALTIVLRAPTTAAFGSNASSQVRQRSTLTTLTANGRSGCATSRPIASSSTSVISRS